MHQPACFLCWARLTVAENRARGRPDLADRIELRLAPSRLRQLLQVKVYHAVACAFEISPLLTISVHPLQKGLGAAADECAKALGLAKGVDEDLAAELQLISSQIAELQHARREALRYAAAEQWVESLAAYEVPDSLGETVL